MTPRLSNRAWVLLSLSLLGAFTYGAFARDWALHEAPAWARVALKTSGVAALALVALSERSSRALVAALGLGALGDALLAFGSSVTFLLGAAAFLLGHLLYVILFLRSGDGFKTFAAPSRWIAAAAVLVVAIVSAVLLRPRDLMGLAAAAIYTIALVAMVLSSFTLPASFRLSAFGAVLFLASDILLTWGANAPPRDPLLARAISDASWFSYYFGQAGLCLGALTLKPR